ncbi:MAG TPA: FecR family protein [Acidobacteriaceae bacterium]|jgi:hypothetical protein|nr:FecR family protein [Acidobacteriaceae bacterium]
MWRRYAFYRRFLGFRLPQRARSLVSFSSAALAFCLFALAAYSQDSVPPPPPDAPSSVQPGEPAQPVQPGEPTPSGQDQNTVRAVRLSDVEGKVQVFQGDQVAFDQAEPNMPAVEGMRFVTGDNGRLEIEFEDGSVARVTPNSSLRLTQLRRATDGSTLTQIDALTGLTYFELSAQGGAISVHYNANIATPVQSAVFRVSLDAAPNELAVMHGAVHLDDGQGVALDVHPNTTYQSDPQQPGEYTVAQNIAADSWDQWNSDRDQALSELESSETTARASSGNPDDPAWNDLDYYGDWYDLPGYGQVWAPSGVDASWDPFGNGSWGYYPSVGYSWISGYPWGWWPYHCGAWDFLDGWGWIWIPGNCGYGFNGGGWFPYATVWHVPRGYTPPPRPRRGPGLLPHPTPVITVNRGNFGAPFHFRHGPRPEPRPLQYDGRDIAPLEATMHPAQRGPSGETFSATLVRTHPELAPSIARAPGAHPGFTPTPGPRPTGSAPVRSFSAPAPRAAGSTSHVSSGGASHPSGGGGGGGSHPSGGGASPHH